jgi:hypothetical protein
MIRFFLPIHKKRILLYPHWNFGFNINNLALMCFVDFIRGYNKSVEPLFAYSFIRGSGMTLHTRINNECPRRYVNRCGTQRIKHTKGHLPLSCFGLEKFSGFRCSKTSANKRLL